MTPLSRLVLALTLVGSPAVAQGPAPAPAPKVAPEDMRWVAPALAEVTDEVLFGEIWRRTDLSPRDRSMITLSALVVGGNTAQMTGHLNRALDNGVKPSEIGALITHLAFYAGWPKAVSSLEVTRRVMESRGLTAADMQPPSLAASDALRLVPKSSGPSRRGESAQFTGVVNVSGAFNGAGGAAIRGATVRFEAGARTAWHRHAKGQTLVVTEGCGWMQREGGPREKICAGDVAMTAPGIKHWHGATATTSMSHVGLSESPEVEWLEHVSDSTYLQTVK